MAGTTEELLDIKLVEDALTKIHTEVKTAIAASEEQIKATGKIATDTQQVIEKLMADAQKTATRLFAVEQKFRGEREPLDDVSRKSLGEQFTLSDQYGAMARGAGRAAVEFATSTFAMERKTAIVNATGASQPLVQPTRVPGIVSAPNRVLRIRDMLPVGPTSSNLIEYAKENVFTNNAAAVYQASPEAFENVTKPESGITFTLASAPVVTLAHFIPASRQVLEDAPQLQTYINGRLQYGLKLVEENQILNGDGTAGQLNGLLNQAIAFSTFASGDTELDKIRKVIGAAQLSEYAPDVIIMNWADWQAIELLKGTDGRYIFSNPHDTGVPRVWGLPIIPTNSIAAGTVLVGSIEQAVQLWDRQQFRIELSRENADNFVKNMVTILAEERLALTVFRPAALRKAFF